MSFKILKIFQKHFEKCPKCGSTKIENRGSFWYCYRCDNEW